jgi:asparagine synthase (glutamine-hydrolysing)
MLMCGLVGFLSKDFDTDRGRHVLQQMSDKIANRGPDDFGVWFDENSQIGLGHRRLSIIDLSPAGAQPMLSASGRYSIAFNGEIYNYLQLRKEMGAQLSWRGHSDTETLLAGFDIWGIQETIERTVGMFAFAVWDKKNHVLTLGRDRLGEKPLYYGWQQGHFLFGSELKALKVYPSFNADINRDSLALLMKHNTIPAPHSIWQGIHKLMPGCLLSVSHESREPVISRYWSGKDAIETSICSPFIGSADEAITALEKVLFDAIDMQMVADVPVGAFLSGGVDSSTIVALMQARSSRPIRSFSIGFNEEQYNEAKYAMAVARHLGTEHTELYVSSEDALSLIPRLPHLYDEPFSDSSQIPTFLVAQLAQQHVTVSLSGDGGDELFCGYNRYLMVNQFWSKLSKLPIHFRQMAAKAILAIPPRLLDRILKSLTQVFPAQYKMALPGDKLRKGASVMASSSFLELYDQMASHWQEPTRLVLGANNLPTLFNSVQEQPCTPTNIEHMMALDMLTYLPDDILTKVDRAAMGTSLETRVPFLDHRVVEFAWSLPMKYKLNNGVGKWALREVLYKYVPKSLIERPKMGFGVPIDKWLRGSLREWAESLLDERRLKEEGFFDVSMVRKKWQAHLNGQPNCQHLLWDVLMFQSWLESTKNEVSSVWLSGS